MSVGFSLPHRARSASRGNMATDTAQAFQCSGCGFLSENFNVFLHHPCTISASTSNDFLGGTVADVPEYNLCSTQQNDDTVLCKESSSLEKWDERSVHLLIEAYEHHRPLFKRGKMTKKHVFEKIAKYFNETSDVTVTGEQCLRKWTKLEQKFKEIEDHNNRTGSGRKDWKFQEQMSACLGRKPNVNPAFTFDASTEAQACRSVSPSTNSSTDNGNGSDLSDDQNVDSVNEAKELRPRRQRKRKSYSSAAEMLTFLEGYTEKREKAEEEKLQLLREMKEEKKRFFSEFLEVLKNK